MDQYKIYRKGSEWHYELTLLNIIFQYEQYDIFNKCYYKLHSRIYIYSCLELIEFIFNFSIWGNDGWNILYFISFKWAFHSKLNVSSYQELYDST